MSTCQRCRGQGAYDDPADRAASGLGYMGTFCPDCSGTGRVPPPGSGSSLRSPSAIPGGPMQARFMCPECGRLEGESHADQPGHVSGIVVRPAPCTDCPEPDDGKGRAYDVPEREALRVPELRRHGYQTVGGIKFALALATIPRLDAVEVTVEEWGEPMADIAIGRSEAHAIVRWLTRWLDGPPVGEEAR